MGGFVKHFNEFAKEIYETCDCNFCNSGIILVVVFSIVKFIIFLRFASNNYRRTVRIPWGVKFFFASM